MTHFNFVNLPWRNNDVTVALPHNRNRKFEVTAKRKPEVYGDCVGRDRTGWLRQVAEKKTRKAPGVLDPAVVFPPLVVQKYYGHSRYELKWCRFLKLVIFLAFGAFAAIPSYIRLPVITWIPFPSFIPWSSTCSNFREEERDEIFWP